MRINEVRMNIEGEYILSTLTEIKPLKPDGRVSLVMDAIDNRLYVKKQFDEKIGLDVHNALKSIRHKNLPQIHHVIENENGYTVIEEYIHGEVLTREAGHVSEPQAYDYFTQLCDVLEYLHSREVPVIHRDIKPDNIIRSNDGVIKLIDFNAAKEYKHWKTEDTVTMGTKNYAAPEQHGYAMTDARTDIYGLGATMFHLLTGTCYNPAVGFNGYNGKFLPVIKKCLQIDPANRYADVRALRGDVRFYFTGSKPERVMHFFPDLTGASKAKKILLRSMYGCFFVSLFFIIAVVIVSSIYNRSVHPGAVISVLLLFIAPYSLASNFMGVRNLIPLFHKKDKYFIAAILSLTAVIVFSFFFVFSVTVDIIIVL
jgi:serine/threonine protein kinase